MRLGLYCIYGGGLMLNALNAISYDNIFRCNRFLGSYPAMSGNKSGLKWQLGG